MVRYRLWSRILQEKYHPSNTMAIVDEYIALNNIKMKANKDPVKLFERIKTVEMRYKIKTRKVSEVEKITIVIS